MISDYYKQQLIQYRRSDPEWGSSAAKKVGYDVLKFLKKRMNIHTVLDFGAGNGMLGKFIAQRLDRPIEWTDYDPSIDGIDVLPGVKQFDCVLSTDLLEHIEPDKLAETLDWMKAHSRHTMFHFIDCNDDPHVLPDGRNVHLIVKPAKWWRAQIEGSGWTTMRYEDIMQLRRGQERFMCLIIVDR